MSKKRSLEKKQYKFPTLIVIFYLFLSILVLSCHESQTTPISSFMEQLKTSVVLVLVLDLIDSQLILVSSGSGTILQRDGTIATNDHVLKDYAGKNHDLFIIARYKENQAPTLTCAGLPSKSLSNEDLDVALIRCDRFLDGSPWKSSVSWPSLPIRKSQLQPKEMVWALGYPLSKDGSLEVQAGNIKGWSEETLPYLRTDLQIQPGYSGGALIDMKGNWVGILMGFKNTKQKKGSLIVSGPKIGLVRPWQQLDTFISENSEILSQSVR